MRQTSNSEEELIKLHFEDMFVRWGRNTPVRTTLHASAVLVPDKDWCVREHTLMNLYPDQALPQELQSWDWKREKIFDAGWKLHQAWQKLFENFGNVVYNDDFPELDLTHYDETREVYFSPDAIIDFAGQRYVVEIKGIKQEAYQELTDELLNAIRVNETVSKAVIQANLYMHLLGLKKAIILVENKNNQDFKVWVIEHDEHLARKYTQRMYDVKGAIINARRTDELKIMPQRICASAGDARAKKCPMRECCFAKED